MRFYKLIVAQLVTTLPAFYGILTAPYPVRQGGPTLLSSGQEQLSGWTQAPGNPYWHYF
jgi:hypothetical protein